MNGARDSQHKKVLVIGGAGYIGSELVRQLLADGFATRVLDCLLFGDQSLRNLYGHPRFDLCQDDLRRPADLRRTLRGVYAVIHLGAIVGDRACAVHERAAWRTNYDGTGTVLDAAGRAGVSRFIFASTCSVYGETDHAAGESSPLKPLSLYAETKARAEQLVLARRVDGLHPAVLRLGTVFGWSARPRFDLAVNWLAAQSVVETEIVIRNGTQWRPFVHVRDAARAFRLALGAPLSRVSGQIFNAGSDALNLQFSDVEEAIRQDLPGTRVRHEFGGDRRNYRVCFEKIRRVLGFRCERSLLAGIREIRGKIEERPGIDYSSAVYHNHLIPPPCIELPAEGPPGRGNGRLRPQVADAEVLAGLTDRDSRGRPPLTGAG